MERSEQAMNAMAPQASVLASQMAAMQALLVANVIIASVTTATVPIIMIPSTYTLLTSQLHLRPESTTSDSWVTPIERNIILCRLSKKLLLEEQHSTKHLGKTRRMQHANQGQQKADCQACKNMSLKRPQNIVIEITTMNLCLGLPNKNDLVEQILTYYVYRKLN
jgi:hypothetical protein